MARCTGGGLTNVKRFPIFQTGNLIQYYSIIARDLDSGEREENHRYDGKSDREAGCQFLQL